MTKKQRTVLLAALTLMLCLALIAGGTYALFSAQFEMTNHLQAGELKVALERTHLKAFALDPVTGYMTLHDEPDTPPKQFTNGTDDNVFGITGDALIHDNADAVSRIERIIQRSRISTREKEHMMAQVLSDAPTHKKLSHMHWPSSESEAVVDAIKELLSLTECEYLGSQL